jgi:hypothetical protein
MRRTALVAAIFLIAAGCAQPSVMTPTESLSLEAALAANTSRLMQTPGVAGVYQGLMDDGKTPGIVVMVETHAAAAGIPKTLAGHPVRVEVSGKIRPLTR